MDERRCSIEGCVKKAHARGWCPMHYQRWRGSGDPDLVKYKWGEQGQSCVVCGGVSPGRRKHCSESCQAADSRHGGARPASATCVLCGKDFSLARRDGRLQRTDTMWCRGCGRQSPEGVRFKRYGIRPETYAAALVAGCEICGRVVDTLHVDHDHSCCSARTFRTCGQCIRGFLCGGCNRAIGLFRDDPLLLHEAARYLTRTRAP